MGYSAAHGSVTRAHFERVATLLRDLDVDTLWDAANGDERLTLVAELVEAVIVHPDRLQVTINGAPPLRVDFEEVGLQPAGMRSMVSKGGLEHLLGRFWAVSADVE